MPKFEVEVNFEVDAMDKDDAWRKVNNWLKGKEYDFFSGIRNITTYDDCVVELEDKDA